MTVSTDGQICFGILFDEGTIFPWDADEYAGDIEEWWTRGVLGFRHSFEIFTPNGYYINGVEPPRERVDAYFEEKRKFEREHEELPIEMINCCSNEYPIWILAVPEMVKVAGRGFPERFNPRELVVTAEQEARLVEFCEKYCIEFEGEPGWYLSSLWS